MGGRVRGLARVVCCLLVAVGSPAQQAAQKPLGSSRAGSAPAAGDTARGPHRTRLILKDGSYQIVMRYSVSGNMVRYVSAERGGSSEEIPLALVDLPATERWERQHQAPALNADGTPQQSGQPPVLDPELAKEEADRAAFAPEVAANLRLDPESSVLALDTYQGTPELVPLSQSDTDLNRQTGHNVIRRTVNPLAASHQVVQLKGERSPVQMHVPDPVLYIRLDDAQPAGDDALTVDTHGASARAARAKPGQPSDYVIVRTDVRQDARVVASFNINALGSERRQQAVVPTRATPLPGGHWLKLQPTENLLFGEYALVEVLNDRELNLGVWDFGVHPMAPENRDVQKPEARRKGSFTRRPQQ